MRVKAGNHNFSKRKDGTSIQTADRLKNKTHNFYDKNGIHIYSNKNPNKILRKNRKENCNVGLHLLKREDGTSLASDRVKKGTHHLLKREDGTSLASDRVKKGTHNWQNNKGTVPCINKVGEFKQISKEMYYSQFGEYKDREWIINHSKEGKKRKRLNMI